MRTIWTLAANDLRLASRDRMSFVWLLAFPVAMMWFFGMMGGGDDSGPNPITLTLVDEDGGWLARALVDELTDEQVDLTEVSPSELAGRENKVRTLRIPAGFTEGVLAGRQQVLRLEKEPGSDQDYGLAAQVHVARAIVRALGNLVEMGPGGGGDPAAVYSGLSHRPPLVGLEVRHAGRGRPVPRGTAQSVPGILTMTVLMMTLIYGGVFLTQEKMEGMLRRQACLPATRRQIFLGKLLGRGLLAGLQIALLVPAARLLFGLSWGSSLAGLLLVLISFSVAVAGLSTLLGAVLSTPEQASGLGWILSMVLAGIGGCWWPSEVMPGWMRTAAHAFPPAWAMDAFHALISFGRGIEAVLVPAAVLLGFGALFSVLGARFLRFE